MSRKADGSILDSYTYTYDNAGNRLAERITQGSVAKDNSYSYDNRNRLTDITTKVIELFGINSKMISFYELGERFPPHDIITKLADYFNK